ncbi:MAG: phage protease [Gallicola sp.]|nr:phage protease [Gallicola sp.]
MITTGNLYALKKDEDLKLSEIRLAVTGQWAGHKSGSFGISSADMEKMVVNFNKRKVDTVIDYEHQTLSGKEAPAAGWIKELKIKNDELWGEVEWTNKAKDYIKSGEYRYLSPVYSFGAVDERSGAWQGCTLHSASLTNKPFLDELGEVVANKNLTKEKDMDKDKNGADNTAWITALKSENDGLKNELESLKKDMSDLNELVANSKVEAALASNKLSSEQKEWALKYCKSDVVGFDEYVKSAKVIKAAAPTNDLFANKGELGDDDLDIAAIALKHINRS